jgi:hypothetical protein
MLKKLAFYIALFLGAAYMFNRIGMSASYSDYKDALSILFGISSMVFTLMGIWIAFLYPNALKRLVNPSKIAHVDFSESLNETKRLESIVGSVLKSAVVAISIMLIFIMRLLLTNTQIYVENYFLIQSLALSTIIVLGGLQLESIFHVIKSNIMFINDLHTKREDKEADNDI